MAQSLSPDAIKLRSMVGLDDKNHVYGNYQSRSFGKLLSEETDTPNFEELLNLIQKQDTVIVDLYSDLDLCRIEMASFKSNTCEIMSRCKVHFDEIKKQYRESSLKLDARHSESQNENPYEVVQNAVELLEKLKKENDLISMELNKTKSALEKVRIENEEITKVNSKNLLESQQNIANMCKNELEFAKDQVNHLACEKGILEAKFESEKKFHQIVSKQLCELRENFFSTQELKDNEISKLIECRQNFEKVNFENASLKQKVQFSLQNLDQKESSWKITLNELHRDNIAIGNNNAIISDKIALISEENTKLRNENTNLKTDIANLNAQFEHLKLAANNSVDSAIKSAKMSFEAKNAEQENFLSQKSKIIDDLKSECGILVKKLESLQKSHSIEVGNLKISNEKLVKRINKLMEIFSNESDNDLIP